VRSEFLVLAYFAHLLPPDRVAAVIDQMIATWEPLLGEIEGHLRNHDGEDARAMSPGMRFAAGYGRAVLGAALTYVREQRAALVREVAESRSRQAPPMALAGD
jgi:hypothetical protein